MSVTTIDSNTTAPTQLLRGKQDTYAYRRLGGGIRRPLICLQHFTGTLDNWDPDRELVPVVREPSERRTPRVSGLGPRISVSVSPVVHATGIGVSRVRFAIRGVLRGTNSRLTSGAPSGRFRCAAKNDTLV